MEKAVAYAISAFTVAFGVVILLVAIHSMRPPSGLALPLF
jgi:hypothetical protein